MNSYQTQSEFFLEFNQFCDFQLWWKTSWWKTRQFEDLMHLIFTFLTEFVAGCLARGIFLYFLVANSSKYLTPSNFACFCNNPPRVHLAWLAVIAHSKTHYSVILDKAFFFFSCVIPPNLSYCIVVSIKWLLERLLFIPSGLLECRPFLLWHTTGVYICVCFWR